MSNNLYIPPKVVVGFQKRADTFTGVLSYITYRDAKGVLRKEKSWESWCNAGLAPIEVDNCPRSGFVLNKGVRRVNDWHGGGRSMVRVHDPLEFEFEITVDNLLNILSYSDVSKKDIMEECVYAWNGTSMVLLPCNSESYREAVSFSKKQGVKFSARSLVAGRQYVTKERKDPLTYIGYYPWMSFETPLYRAALYSQSSEGNKHVFHDGESFILFPPPKLAYEVSDVDNPDLANLVEIFMNSVHSRKIVDAEIVPFNSRDVIFERRPKMFRKINGKIESAGLPSWTEDKRPGGHRFRENRDAEDGHDGKLYLQRYAYRLKGMDQDDSAGNIIFDAVRQMDYFELAYDSTGNDHSRVGPGDITPMAKIPDPMCCGFKYTENFMEKMASHGFGDIAFRLEGGGLHRYSGSGSLSAFARDCSLYNPVD